MAQVPEAPQINPEAFDKEYRDLVAKLSGPINQYAELVNEVLNKNLTFGDNFRGEIKILTFGAGETTKKFKFESGTPDGLWVVNQRNLTDPTILNDSIVQAQWRWDGKTNVEITSILGLNPDYKYDITFIIVAK